MCVCVGGDVCVLGVWGGRCLMYVIVCVRVCYSNNIFSNMHA